MTSIATNKMRHMVELTKIDSLGDRKISINSQLIESFWERHEGKGTIIRLVTSSYEYHIKENYDEVKKAISKAKDFVF